MTPPMDGSGDTPCHRVRALIGCYREDLLDMPHSVTPVVAAVVDELVWDHETEQDTQARWALAKEAYDPLGVNYEWREVWIVVDDAALRAPFLVPDVRADVEADA